MNNSTEDAALAGAMLMVHLGGRVLPVAHRFVYTGRNSGIILVEEALYNQHLSQPIVMRRP